MIKKEDHVEVGDVAARSSSFIPGMQWDASTSRDAARYLNGDQRSSRLTIDRVAPNDLALKDRAKSQHALVRHGRRTDSSIGVSFG